jgi:hypothetical protein
MRLFACLIFLGMLFMADCGEAQVRIFELRHVHEEQVLSVADNLLGGGGTAEVLNGRLIVDGPEDTLDDIARLLRQVDVPPRMVRVSVCLEKGLRGPARRLGNASARQEYRIVVLDGEAGLIRLTEKVPFVEQLIAVHGRRQGYGRRVGFVETASGFWVRPRLLEGQAMLELRPWFGEARPAENVVMQTPKTEILQAATVVRVALDEWVDLGSRLDKTLSATSSHAGKSLGNVSRATRLWLKVESPGNER